MRWEKTIVGLGIGKAKSTKLRKEMKNGMPDGWPFCKGMLVRIEGWKDLLNKSIARIATQTCG